jgi:membrane-associated protease RseP (regulator of RpoE activity)
MFRKVFVFILLTITASAAAYGQKKTTATPKSDSSGAVFAYSLGGSSGFIGVQIEEVTKENMGQYGLKEVRGVAIEKVLDDSPAQAAGLQNGDVIIKFNGEEITSERKLIRLLSEVAPDHEAKIRVVRGGDERDITVTVGKHPGFKFDNEAFAKTLGSRIGRMPAMPAMPKMPEWKAGDLPRAYTFVGSGRYIGASLMTLTKQLGDYFGIADGKGMLITEVRENTPAAKAGLKAGDVIVEVDGKEFTKDNSLFQVLHEKKEGDITLTVIRDRNRQTFTVTPEARKAGSMGELFEGYAPGQFTVAAPVIAPEAIAPLKLMTAPMAPIAPMAPMPFLLPGRVL